MVRITSVDVLRMKSVKCRGSKCEKRRKRNSSEVRKTITDGVKERRKI